MADSVFSFRGNESDPQRPTPLGVVEKESLDHRVLQEQSNQVQTRLTSCLQDEQVTIQYAIQPLAWSEIMLDKYWYVAYVSFYSIGKSLQRGSRCMTRRNMEPGIVTCGQSYIWVWSRPNEGHERPASAIARSNPKPVRSGNHTILLRD